MTVSHGKTSLYMATARELHASSPADRHRQDRGLQYPVQCIALLNPCLLLLAQRTDAGKVKDDRFRSAFAGIIIPTGMLATALESILLPHLTRAINRLNGSIRPIRPQG